MGEPKKLTNHIKEDKQKVAVNLANGGGVGVGIVFIGGALATAALVSVLTVGRRLLKSTDSKNQNHCPSTGSAETPEVFIAEKIGTNDKDESKGVLFIPPDSSPDVHQNLSNGAAQTTTTEIDISPISSKSFFPEEKHILEPYTGRRDHICDDEEILLSIRQGSDGRMQCNGSVATEELSFSVIKDQVLFQKAFKAKMIEEPYGREIEIIGEKNTTEFPDADHGTEEESKLMQVNDDQKISDVKCKEAAETAEADHNAALILQSNKERGSNLIDHDEASNGTGCLPSKSSVPVDQDFFVQLHHNSSICKDEKLKSDCKQGSQAFETVETLEGAEAVRAVDVEKGQGHNMILEEIEKKCDEHEVWLITETAEQLKWDETFQAVHADQGNEEEKLCSQHDHPLIVQSVEVPQIDENLNADQEVEGNSGLLIVRTAGVLEGDDKLDAGHADGGYSSTVRISGEEEKLDQHDGSQTVEHARGLKEYVALEPALVGKDEMEILMLEKETDAEHVNESDATKLLDDIAPISSSGLQEQPTEEQESLLIDIQEDHNVSDMTTSERVTSESCGAQEPNIFLEVQGLPSHLERRSGSDSRFELLAEDTEVRQETVSGEPAIDESEGRLIEGDIHTLKQSIINTSEEIEETPATNLCVTGQMEMSEEDSIDDDADEANITDTVEENPEGTGDSSVEYSTEPFSPAESLEKLPRQLTELKLNDQKEKQQAEENSTLSTKEKMYLDEVERCGISAESLQNINKGTNNSELTFLEKYMLELAANSQQIHSLKPRILGLARAFMVLSWALCFWYFGLPFLKISLIVILVILLSKIQGI